MKYEGFQRRIIDSSKKHSSRLVIALDIVSNDRSTILKGALNILDEVSPYIAAIKLNYHVLLPLSLFEDVKMIVDRAHNEGLQVIADLKLNDIESTNLVATNYLWSVGFDAAIVNPFVGYEGGLKQVIDEAHRNERGIILLVYMSHPGAREGYGLTVIDPIQSKRLYIYELFLDRALNWGVDGIIVGATVPKLINEVAMKVQKKLLIFCPGVGVQGGDIYETVKAGADFIIVGRSIINAPNPRKVAEEMCRATFSPWSL
ncbi:MAG: orotidine-5'-phosphate decarboxylase [Nitrososphaerota archaeon]|nr:orotidine-5'-phosphate decarboxylase [Nitrososphaerales archaeon]MDW8044971.1 orotidine-5'-phosphate decarboxylase [Nitrososphaerota archaeon]